MNPGSIIEALPEPSLRRLWNCQSQDRLCLDDGFREATRLLVVWHPSCLPFDAVCSIMRLPNWQRHTVGHKNAAASVVTVGAFPGNVWHTATSAAGLQTDQHAACSQGCPAVLAYLACIGPQPPVLLELTRHGKPVDQHSPSLTCASERGIPDRVIEGAAGIHNNVDLVALGQSRQCREQDAHVGHDASNQELLAPSGLQGGRLRG